VVDQKFSDEVPADGEYISTSYHSSDSADASDSSRSL